MDNIKFYGRKKFYYIIMLIFIAQLTYLMVLKNDIIITVVLTPIVITIIFYNIRLIILNENSLVFVNTFSWGKFKNIFYLKDIDSILIKKSIFKRVFEITLKNNKKLEVNITYYRYHVIKRLIKILKSRNINIISEPVINKRVVYYPTNTISNLPFAIVFGPIFFYVKSIPIENFNKFIIVILAYSLFIFFGEFYFLKIDIKQLTIIKLTKLFYYKRTFQLLEIDSLLIKKYVNACRLKINTTDGKYYKYALNGYGRLEFQDLIDDLNEFGIKYEVQIKRGKEED